MEYRPVSEHGGELPWIQPGSSDVRRSLPPRRHAALSVEGTGVDLHGIESARIGPNQAHLRSGAGGRRLSPAAATDRTTPGNGAALSTRRNAFRAQFSQLTH